MNASPNVILGAKEVTIGEACSMYAEINMWVTIGKPNEQFLSENTGADGRKTRVSGLTRRTKLTLRLRPSVLGSVLEQCCTCFGQLWPYLYSPVRGSSFRFFLFFVRVCMICNLNWHFCKLRRESNSGTKELTCMLKKWAGELGCSVC